MARIALGATAVAVAAVPGLTFERLAATLDPARGNRIDPDKLVLLEAACYAAAILLAAVAILLPRIIEGLHGLAARLESSARARPLRRRRSAAPAERILVAVFVVLVVALPVNLVLNRSSGIELAVEDGPLESATALLYLLAAGLNVLACRRFRGAPITRACLLALAALFFVVGMEEISWGQRLVGVDTPAGLDGLNVQGEITLHNVWSTSINQALGLLVTFVLLVALPLSYRHSRLLRRLADQAGVPVAPTSTAGLYLMAAVAAGVIGVQLGTLGIGPRSLYGLQPHFDDEYLEFFLSCLFLVVSAGGWRLVPGPPAPSRGRLATVAEPRSLSRAR